MNLDHQESALRASQMHRIPDGYWPRDAANREDCEACTTAGTRCQTPDACWLPDAKRETNDWRDAIKDCAVVIFVVACAAVAAAVIF